MYPNYSNAVKQKCCTQHILNMGPITGSRHREEKINNVDTSEKYNILILVYLFKEKF